jgi:hypothetical protein
MDEVNLIEDELWDHYSGLPNPLWYEFKKHLDEERDSDEDAEDFVIINKEI